VGGGAELAGPGRVVMKKQFARLWFVGGGAEL